MRSRRTTAWGLTLALTALGLTACTHAKKLTASPRASESARTATPWRSPAGTSARPEPVRYALVAADGRRVTVTAVGGGCTQARHLTATESADLVSLRLVVYDSSGACASVLRVFTESTVLTAPLGARRLVDGLNGRAVHYFDGRKLADVGWLPRGALPAEDRLDGAAWIRIYSFHGKQAAAPIEVEQAPGNIIGRNALRAYPGRVVTSTRVHGLPAKLFVERDESGALVTTRLAWVEAGYTFVVASYLLRVPGRAFPPAILARVARDLRLPHASG